MVIEISKSKNILAEDIRIVPSTPFNEKHNKLSITLFLLSLFINEFYQYPSNFLIIIILPLQCLQLWKG